MGVSKSSWDVGPPVDVLRFDQPEIPIHGRKKNTRRWCRGKVGREHEPEIRYTKWHDSSVAAGFERGCVWVPFYRYRRSEDGGRTREISRWWWSCQHELGCSVCGKILVARLGRKCPEFRERT